VSVFAVIAGLEYPFWIVPALVILSVTGLGPPGGPPQVVLIRNNTTTGVKDHRQNSNNSNDRTSVIVEDTHSPTAVFNHLLRFSVDVSDVDAGQYASKAPSAHMATLVFQVYSSCWFGRYRLEGCGYHHLSDRPGHEEVEIKTWKPVGGIRDKMHDLFLGNAVQFKDDMFVDSVNKASVVLNKFGVQSQSSGGIFLRTQTISADARLIDDFFREHSEVVMQAEASNKIKKTVDDILKSFRSSSGLPMRASSSRETLGIAALTPSKQASRREDPNKPSVSSILASLNNASRDKDNKVAEILSRARAKVRGGTSIAASTPSRARSTSKMLFGSGGGTNIDSSPFKDMNTPYDPFIPTGTVTGTQPSSSLSSSSKDANSLTIDSTMIDRSIRLDRKAIPPIHGLGRQPHRYESSSRDNINETTTTAPLSPHKVRQSDANDDDGEEAPLLTT